MLGGFSIKNIIISILISFLLKDFILRADLSVLEQAVAVALFAIVPFWVIETVEMKVLGDD